MVPGRALVLALVMTLAAANAVLAQPSPPQCNDFARLRTDAEEKATAIRAASARKVERKEMCALFQRFAAAESTMVKFLEDNRVWCGVPEQAIKNAKANHVKTVKIRTSVCSTDQVGSGPRPKAPTLSDALNTPRVDTPENTKTGRGTFDTLTGSPLAR
jgi:hypothetical protein